jgi:hypothetical protein
VLVPAVTDQEPVVCCATLVKPDPLPTKLAPVTFPVADTLPVVVMLPVTDVIPVAVMFPAFTLPVVDTTVLEATVLEITALAAMFMYELRSAICFPYYPALYVRQVVPL